MSKDPKESVRVTLPPSDVGEVDIFDVSLMLSEQCVEDIHVDVAGVMLTTAAGELELVAASSESTRIRDLFELQLREGAGAACFESGPIVNHLFKGEDAQWPKLTARALEQGFSTMHCIPMRLEDKTIGVLGCFATNQRWLGEHDLALVQDMADIATVAIFQSQLAFDATRLSEQLTIAFESRVVIEQAKGIVSQSLDGDIDEAFQQIRAYARNHNLGLRKVAGDISGGVIAPEEVIAANLKKSESSLKR